MSDTLDERRFPVHGLVMHGGRRTVVAFGELLLRLDTKGYQRFTQAEEFTVRYTGAEANAAVCLARLGVDARVVSRVPAHDIGQACVDAMRRHGVNTDHIQRGGDRLGILYVETGAGQRPSRVIYDRGGSAFRTMEPERIDWPTVLKGADILHFSGTAPALGDNVVRALEAGLGRAREAGVSVSFDCNWRSALWTRERMRSVVCRLLPSVDLFLGSLADAALVCGTGEMEDRSGLPPAGRAEAWASRLRDRFGIRRAAFSVREGASSSLTRFTGFLVENGRAYASRTHETAVVDRIGSGDAYAAGLLFGTLEAMGPQETVEFAAAAASLKNTIPGDVLLSVREEIERAARGEDGGILR